MIFEINNPKRQMPSTLGRTSPHLLGIVYVLDPSFSTIVLPYLIQGALKRIVWPLIGYIALSSTPPNNRAPSPAQTTTASTFDGFPEPERPVAPPSTTWLMCCIMPRIIDPPLDRKRKSK